MQALWMIAGAFLFATMAVCVKNASAWFSESEIVFWRGLVGMLLMWIVARCQKVTLKTQYPLMHARRSVFGVISLGSWVYALGVLPLASVTTLNYMSSVWVTAFVVLQVFIEARRNVFASWSERIGMQAGVVIAGFAGAVMVLRPSIRHHDFAGASMGLLSGITAAFAYRQVIALGDVDEPEARTVFYFGLGSALAGGVGIAVGDSTVWTWPHVWWIALASLLAALGQLCMTRAFSRGAPLIAASLQYLGIVFSAIYGALLFSDHISPSGWAGIVLIIGSALFATTFRLQTEYPASSAGADR
jgi:drug/metabolite transporter (DMT)-like permease